MTSVEPNAPAPVEEMRAAPIAKPPATHGAVESAPPVVPVRTRLVLRLAIVGSIVLIALLVYGIVPRTKLQHQLAADVVASGDALVVVTAFAAQHPTTPNTLVLPGTMEALHETAVYARVAGYVRRFHADLGTMVRAGQLLAEIDAPELEQQVLQARAQLAQMQSALALARSNYERWRMLAADSAVTTQELQQMEQAYEAAAASVRAAEANLRALLSMLQYSRVTAPFAGVVVARNVDNGSLISATGASSTPLTAGGSGFSSPTTVSAASLFRLAQTDTMRVYVGVPQLYLSSIQPGLAADVHIDDLGGRVFRGTVVRTARSIDVTTRSLLVEVDVPNAARLLVPGMNARVSITLQRVGAPLVIPSTALVVRTGGPQVMQLVRLAGDTAIVRFHDVQVARDNGSSVEIVSGLADSAMVASIGTQILTEGQRVRIARPANDSTGSTAAPSSIVPSRAVAPKAVAGRN
jgi:multidrug efflux pump subunit AcrA (membrane-fusion protein)